MQMLYTKKTCSRPSEETSEAEGLRLKVGRKGMRVACEFLAPVERKGLMRPVMWFRRLESVKIGWVK
jgi:hypothetical protein